MPQPERAANGRRRYSDEEVRRVQLIAELLNTGAQISDIVQLPEIELAEMLQARRLAADVQSQPEPAVLERLKSSIVSRDPIRFRRELGVAMTSMPPLACVEDVLSPIMQYIGEEWEAGRLPVAMEHVASALVRQTMMGAASQQGWTDEGPIFLFGTCAGEYHEFGILFAWYLAVSKGVRSIYLGVNLPHEELLGAFELFGAQTLVLSMVRPDNDLSVMHDVEFIGSKLPSNSELWVGRPPSSKADFQYVPKVKTFTSYSAYQHAVQRRRMLLQK